MPPVASFSKVINDYFSKEGVTTALLEYKWSATIWIVSSNGTLVKSEHTSKLKHLSPGCNVNLFSFSKKWSVEFNIKRSGKFGLIKESRYFAS